MEVIGVGIILWVILEFIKWDPDKEESVKHNERPEKDD